MLNLEEELSLKNIIDHIAQLNKFIFSSQIIFIRLLMHRCKWLRRSTIIYEISDLSNNANYSIRHVETDLLQDNDLDASIYLLNNDQICDFCKTK
ncbi:unnamed protein product [Rotaria sp. Silwood1]|nr:unnamed protein product [Rotaria sp. Silwood1]